MKVHGKVPFPEALIAHAVEYGVPKTYFNDSMTQLLIFMSKFVMRAFRVWMCNPSRQRRKIMFVTEDASYITGEVLSIMRDCDIRKMTLKSISFIVFAKQADALDVKNLPPSAKNERDDAPHYLVYWVSDWTLKFMIEHLQLGFELEIYDENEYPMIWWYLDNLSTMRFVLRFRHCESGFQLIC
jgi:hypothetical protein